MKNNTKTITDLKDLVLIVNDGKEGYKVAAEATGDLFLKELFLKLMQERMLFEQELKTALLKLGAVEENEKGGVLGFIHRSWLEIKDALNTRDEAAILNAIKTGEQAALHKYDFYIDHYADNQAELTLLLKHRSGILNALKEVEELYKQYTN